MKKLVHHCLAHPCWSGVSGIVAILSATLAMKWPWAAASEETPVDPSLVATQALMESSPSSTTVADEPPATPEIPDLSGRWEIETEIMTSTFSPYVGLKVYYQVGIAHTNGVVQVAGEKDGEQKPDTVRMIYEGKGRTSFNGEGTIEVKGDRVVVKLDVEENGSRRKEIGTSFVLEIGSSGTLGGTFRSEAAATTGRSIWTRVDD